jgi:hypothetical protein
MRPYPGKQLAVIATLVAAGLGRRSGRRAAVVVTGIVGEADAIQR